MGNQQTNFGIFHPKQSQNNVHNNIYPKKLRKRNFIDQKLLPQQSNQQYEPISFRSLKSKSSCRSKKNMRNCQEIIQNYKEIMELTKQVYMHKNLYQTQIYGLQDQQEKLSYNMSKLVPNKKYDQVYQQIMQNIQQQKFSNKMSLLGSYIKTEDSQRLTQRSKKLSQLVSTKKKEKIKKIEGKNIVNNKQKPIINILDKYKYSFGQKPIQNLFQNQSKQKNKQNNFMSKDQSRQSTENPYEYQYLKGIQNIKSIGLINGQQQQFFQTISQKTQEQSDAIVINIDLQTYINKLKDKEVKNNQSNKHKKKVK